jgi:glycosyltransferase involved in cell wall biosynthesis
MISAVILTNNSGKTIEALLDDLAFADEIILVDDESVDETVQRARKRGAVVFSRPLGDDFSSQRNFGLKKAKGEWVLFVDSDERVESQLRKEILEAIKHADADGFYLRRTDELFGKILRHGETANVRLLRLGRKGKGEWKRTVHEIWEINGKTSELMHPLRHTPHPTAGEFISSLNKYSTLNACFFFASGVKTNLFEILFYPFGKFVLNYIFRLGFLDGTEGCILAIMMSFHSFLTRSKLWLLWFRSVKP